MAHCSLFRKKSFRSNDISSTYQKQTDVFCTNGADKDRAEQSRADNNLSKWDGTKRWLIFRGIFHGFGVQWEYVLPTITVTHVACSLDVSTDERSVSCLLTQGRAALAHCDQPPLQLSRPQGARWFKARSSMVVFHSWTYWSPDKSHFLSIVSSPKPGATAETPRVIYHLSLVWLLEHCFICTTLWVSLKEILDVILVFIFTWWVPQYVHPHPSRCPSITDSELGPALLTP